MKTQNAAILAHLKSGKSITPIEALNRFGCFRLGARIYDLKRAGIPIKSIRISDNGKSYAKYHLAG